MAVGHHHRQPDGASVPEGVERAGVEQPGVVHAVDRLREWREERGVVALASEPQHRLAYVDKAERLAHLLVARPEARGRRLAERGADAAVDGRTRAAGVEQRVVEVEQQDRGGLGRRHGPIGRPIAPTAVDDGLAALHDEADALALL